MAKISGKKPNGNTSTPKKEKPVTDTNTAPKAPRVKLSLQQQIVQRISRVAQTLVVQGTKNTAGRALPRMLSRLDHEAALLCAQAVDAAFGALATAINYAKEIPADLEPTRKGGGGGGGGKASKVEIGSTVAIRDKRKGDYDGLLADDEMTALVVTAQRGSRLVVTTAGGAKLFIPKGHVTAAKADATA